MRHVVQKLEQPVAAKREDDLDSPPCSLAHPDNLIALVDEELDLRLEPVDFRFQPVVPLFEMF